VITMRSDYLGHCVAFLGLPEAVNSGIYLTPRLQPQQLKSVIASPLALVGGEIDPVLVNRLVNTLESEDELPVLEHALLRMWNRARAARRSRIESDDFEAVCAPRDDATGPGDLSPPTPGQPRLSVAIDIHTSEIYEELPPQTEPLARQLFLALVERHDGLDVRRPQTVSQLVEQVGEHERGNLHAVIDAFRAEQAGFLLPPASEKLSDDKVIDISHESLFRHWHLLRQWLAEEDLDAAELKEWHHRAIMRGKGGGWLDASDCDRALRWRARVEERTNPALWARRYGGPETWVQVSDYVEASLDRLTEAKAERERL
jgi:hypothetical protein